MPLILYKDNANRMQNEINDFISFAEVQFILYKDNANRMQNEINDFISFAEVQLILYKGNDISLSFGNPTPKF